MLKVEVLLHLLAWPHDLLNLSDPLFTDIKFHLGLINTYTLCGAMTTIKLQTRGFNAMNEETVNSL